MKALAPAIFLLVVAACGAPEGKPADKVVEAIDAYYGRTINVRTKLKSGARCRVGEDGEWKTYCKDCQYCKGPYVVDLGGTDTATNTVDWPLVLGGTFEMEDIRCKGPLNQIECKPFELGQEYVIRGMVERGRPPRLIVEKFWKVK